MFQSTTLQGQAGLSQELISFLGKLSFFSRVIVHNFMTSLHKVQLSIYLVLVHKSLAILGVHFPANRYGIILGRKQSNITNI